MNTKTLNDDFEYGSAGDGIETLLEAVRGIVLGQAAEQAKEGDNGLLNNVINVCNSYWEGQARLRYVENLKKDANTFATALNQLYSAFESEVRNAGSAYMEFDASLFKE